METANPVSQSALTIKEVIGQVRGRRCLLPVPKEGELISSPEQITRLFDLLMQERSVGQLILWSIGIDRLGEYDFCDFLGNGNGSLASTEESCPAHSETVAVVIDGKRRLASLYVGLLGFHKGSASCGNQETDDFLQVRKLYLNILSGIDQPGRCYDFRFLTESESSLHDEKALWFEVGRVLGFTKPEEIDCYLHERGLERNQFSRDCLHKLQNVIDEKRSVSCVVEKDEEVGKVFLMFL